MSPILYILLGLVFISFFFAIRIFKKDWKRLRNEEKKMIEEEKAENLFIFIHEGTIVHSIDDLKVAFTEYKNLGFKSFRINEFLCDKVQELLNKNRS